MLVRILTSANEFTLLFHDETLIMSSAPSFKKIIERN